MSKPQGLPPLPKTRYRRFRLEEYHKLIQLGVLQEDDRCELLDGVITASMPPNPPHTKAMRQLLRRLPPLLPEEDYIVSIQDPITILSVPDTEPQPDMMVAIGPEQRYQGRNPNGRDILLVIEISDTSLTDDRTTKLALYAAEKIPQYWIVNLPARCVEVYTQPRGGKSPQYRTRTDYPADATLPVFLAGQALGSLTVAEILP
ncbi:MAG: Uma2 family endonuclease [Bacteroidales bacterium]|nr:Uma2 family endonuclease [Bacteroidales bacterium]